MNDVSRMSASGELVNEAMCVTSIYTNNNRHNVYSDAKCRLFSPSVKECEQLSRPIQCHVALGGLVVSVLATGPNVRGFNPGRGRWIFKGDKNP
jgi:hypothetical protein